MKLALGTVQFGLPYGSRRPAAPVSPNEVSSILAHAWSNGVDMLDSAPAYGRAEEVIAAARPAAARFAVVTKTLPLATVSGVAEVAARVRRSREVLGDLSAVLVHDDADLLGADGEALFAALAALRREGVAARIGASVYDPEVLEKLLDRYPIECVQLPMNILDQRFLQSGLLERLRQGGVQVHVRSVYLQGRLLMEPDRLPPEFAKARSTIEAFRRKARSSGLSPAAALMRFIMCCGNVDRLVIGVDGLADLIDTILSFESAASSREAFDASSFAMADPEIIDPRRWVR